MLSVKKILRYQLYWFTCRKYLDVACIISLIVLFSVIIKCQYFTSWPALKIVSANNTSISSSGSIKMTPELVQPPTATENSNQKKLKQILNCHNIPLYEEKLQYGEYWLLKNYIRGNKSTYMGCTESITYTTNADYTFIGILPTVVERWLAPISFAIYAPGDDYNSTMDSIQYVRNCLTQSELIRDYVTFHIFFPENHLPKFIAKNEREALNWSYDCRLQAPYANVDRSKLYRSVKNLTYPINVGRNIARKTANTYFIFACDIELYPSLGLVEKFMEMVAKNPAMIVSNETPKVFVLPVFEIGKQATLPYDKVELQHLLNKSLAVPFHKYVCANCHLVPKQKDWLKANNTQELQIFTIAKRYNAFKFWEPFYISDNKEPIFDERVTWEGQSNKRIQNYAMCLLDYEYHVLHPAFLVHAPGIKVLNIATNATKLRFKYAANMNKIISKKIIPEYKVLYGNNKNCMV